MATAIDRKPVQALSGGHFRRIAERGFGSGFNHYPYSYAWYDDHLYIGTNRNALQVIIMRWPFEAPFAHPPVPVPDSYEKLDLRGQIWRYSPKTGAWERVFRSPMVVGYEGRLAPVAVAFRCMTVFQGKSDERPALYTLPVVGRNAPGCATLRSLDGLNFEKLEPPRIEGEHENFGGFRAVQPFKGRLWVAPSHSKGDPKVLKTDPNVAENVDVRCTDDPVNGRWEVSCPPGFGDPANRGIIEMQVCGDYLYVGTLNIREGFQVWRTNGEGPAPHRWQKILDHGAGRGPFNQAVLSMAAFQGNLYIGTAIQNGGHDRSNNIGPAAGEVLRVYPDGSWDLVVGFPRLTNQGLKIPTSGMGPGFDNPLAGYIWRMCAHDGALYVGTFDVSSYVPYMDRSIWPAHVANLFDDETLDRFLKHRGGAELWRTTDGDNWLPVTRNGFNNFYNFGIRALVSSPAGLFVGAANPFGPKVAVRTPSGWRYEDNPRGGLEIWHGSLDHADAPPSDTVELHALPRASEGLSLAHMGIEAETEESRAAMFLAEETELHAVGQLHDSLWEACQLNPVLHLADQEKDLVGLTASVGTEIDEYFHHTPIRNVGYWSTDSTTPAQAARALAAEVFAVLSSQDAIADKQVLIIARGAEEIAKQSSEFSPRYVTCIDPSVAAPHKWFSRRRAPATIDQLPAESHDAVIWIEGFAGVGLSSNLRHVARVLRSGGWLSAAEIAGTRLDQFAKDADSSPTVTRFAEALRAAGFENCELRDIARVGWRRFHQHSRQYFLTKLLLQQVDADLHRLIVEALPGGSLAVDAHLLISAQKVNPRGTE
ncbi:MAG: hypothetical protein K1X71_08280 [Pirellulales bacterium]|nr:hypothetical protein [Pirellulales bacterium]